MQTRDADVIFSGDNRYATLFMEYIVESMVASQNLF